MKTIIYPFTYEQWLAHPSTKPKIKLCKELAKKIDDAKKYGQQFIINL